MRCLCRMKWMLLCAILCFLSGPEAMPRQQNAGSELVHSSGIEIFHGYLIDLVCAKEEATRLAELGAHHTRKCLEMPACIKGGFGVLLSSNEVLSFDQRGNQLALALVSRRRHREKGFVIKVRGKYTDGCVEVFRID